MKKLLRWGVRGLLGLLLVAGGLLAHTLWFKPLKIEWFYERVFADYAFNSPELLSSLRMLPVWLNCYSVSWTMRRCRMMRRSQRDPSQWCS
jgi:hypothetical protein